MSNENEMTPGELVVAAVMRDQDRYLDERITPFATARQLMGGEPPSRLRWFARRAWFKTLRKRTDREVKKQAVFAATVRRLTTP